MEEIVKFLKEAETYYLATVEGDQPRVRPFGTAHIFEGKLYIQTGKKKDVSKQLHTALREWLKMADAAAFRIRDSKAQIVVRQHCLDRIPLKAVEFENGKHMGKTAVFYHKKIGLKQFSEELFSNREQMRQLEKKFCKN